MTFFTAMGFYGYGYPMGFYFDPTMIFVIIGAVISIWEGEFHLPQIFPGSEHERYDRSGNGQKDSGFSGTL